MASIREKSQVLSNSIQAKAMYLTIQYLQFMELLKQPMGTFLNPLL